MKLLKEMNQFVFEKQDIEKSLKENNGKIILKGVIQRADAQNQNGRVYPKSILLREIENYKKLVKERRAHGELDHDDSAVVNLKNVSHIITDIWMEDNGDVIGTVEVLKTPMGQILRSLIEDQVTVGISSRALGSVHHINGVDYVQDDLHFVCWDFVSEPSTHGAYMFKEAKEVDPRIIKKIFSREDRINRTVNKLLEINKKK
jgi:hypothetical protein